MSNSTTYIRYLVLTVFCLVGLDATAQVLDVSAGNAFTCAVLGGFEVRCWGENSVGQLGYGNTDPIGDDEEPYMAGDVPTGVDAIQVSAGGGHVCVLTTGNDVKCWGWNDRGQLGLGSVGNNIGDTEPASSTGIVSLGQNVTQVSAGTWHTCVVTQVQAVKCWGWGLNGMLGYASIQSIGDDELPSDSGNVFVGAAVTQVDAGRLHTCVRTVGQTVRCWGYGGDGQLGYHGTTSIGNSAHPADSGDVNVGASVNMVSAGDAHTCVVTTGQKVRCWGLGDDGRLGYGNTDIIGDDEYPADAGDVNVGTDVVQVSAGGSHTCVATTGQTVRCWGKGGAGQLGYGNVFDIGDDEDPSSAGDVNVGLPIVSVSAGFVHTCVLTAGNAVRCWGAGGDGRLGYGNGNSVGQSDTPDDVGDVPLFDPTLPVELSGFDARVHGDAVTLTWTTESEVNNAGFEIHRVFERSGQTFWDVAGFVKGSGTTDEPQSYRFEFDDLDAGRHRFRLKQIDFDGAFEFSGEIEVVVEVPSSHVVSAAYPNPFNPRSNFSIAVPVEQHVTATLHDASGRLVSTLFEGTVSANDQHWVSIDGADLSSGLYLYRVEGQGFVETKSVTLLK